MIVSKTGNRKRKADTIILSAAFVILSIVLLFSSLFAIMQSFYFDYAFEKYDVYERFERERALEANENILDFLNHENSLDSNFLMEDEISHLEDVRHILDRIKLIYHFSLVLLFVLLIIYGHEIFKVSSTILLILFIFLLIYYIFGFDFVFLRFHQIFFTGNYAFDPSVSNMKAIYPDGLFMFFSQLFYLKTVIKTIILTLSWKYLYSPK